jgi:hypothetical protein
VRDMAHWQLGPVERALERPAGRWQGRKYMRGHLAHSACEAAGSRRKPRLGGEAAHRFPRAKASIRSAIFLCILVTDP